MTAEPILLTLLFSSFPPQTNYKIKSTITTKRSQKQQPRQKASPTPYILLILRKKKDWLQTPLLFAKSCHICLSLLFTLFHHCAVTEIPANSLIYTVPRSPFI